MDAKGRWWFGLTALAVLAGLIVQILVTADLETGFFDTPTERALNVFAFFTIQSNIIVGVTSLLLALAYRSWLLTRDDEVRDDAGDRAAARADVVREEVADQEQVIAREEAP